MNLIPTRRARVERKIPLVEANTGKLIPAWGVLVLQICIGLAIIALCTRFAIPWLAGVLALVYLVCAAAVIKQYNALLVYLNIVLALIVALSGSGSALNFGVLGLASLVVLTLRTHSLLQFSRPGVKIELAVLAAELKLALGICAGLWVVGALVILIGGLGNGPVALALTLLGAVVLVACVFGSEILGWIRTRLMAR